MENNKIRNAYLKFNYLSNLFIALLNCPSKKPTEDFF